MTILIPILAAIAFAIPVAAIAGDDDLVVVVNKSNAVSNVTKAELNKMILGEKASWAAGKVNVILRSPGQPEREGVLRSICGMSENDFTQHWMKSNFGGDAASPPKALASGVAVRQLVMSIPGAIGFLRPADVNDTVKAVNVDGMAAGAAGYKVKAGK